MGAVAFETDDALLQALGAERFNDDPKRDDRIVELIDLCIARGIYPRETLPGNPNDVYAMVRGWGADWIHYKMPHACLHCGVDLCDRVIGPPFKREIAAYNRARDCTTGFFCPDCQKPTR